MSLPERIASVLRHIFGDPCLAGRFLNTLSFLEYVGTRKILKSQRAETIDAVVLGHIAEEARHALSIKRLAMAVSPVPISTYEPEHLFVGVGAGRYFQELDHGVEADLGALPTIASASDGCSPLNYLYTTCLIEKRALSLYPPIEGILAGQGRPGTFASIVREEERHLAQVCRAIGELDPDVGPRTARLQQLEEGLFERFLSALEEEAEP